MNYYRDLLPESKVSGSKLTMGAIGLFNAVLIPARAISSGEEIEASGWLALGIGLIVCAYWIMGGLGYRLWRVPGKAYVRIDDEAMALKPYLLSTEKAVRWKDVNDILYSAEKYTMRTRDGGKVDFEHTTLPYAVIQEIKAAIDELAAEKKINIIRRVARESTEYTNRHMELS